MASWDGRISRWKNGIKRQNMRRRHDKGTRLCPQKNILAASTMYPMKNGYGDTLRHRRKIRKGLPFLLILRRLLIPQMPKVFRFITDTTVSCPIRISSSFLKRVTFENHYLKSQIIRQKHSMRTTGTKNSGINTPTATGTSF